VKIKELEERIDLTEMILAVLMFWNIILTVIVANGYIIPNIMAWHESLETGTRGFVDGMFYTIFGLFVLWILYKMHFYFREVA